MNDQTCPAVIGAALVFVFLTTPIHVVEGAPGRSHAGAWVMPHAGVVGPNPAGELIINSSANLNALRRKCLLPY